jgi:hypothetical protein
MGIGTILVLIAVVGLMMSLFWIAMRPSGDFASRDDR